MMKPGEVIFWIPDALDAGDRARAFCKSRGLSGEDVRIVRRAHDAWGKMVMAEVKRPCRLKVE
jgi:hypothetical protein